MSSQECNKEKSLESTSRIAAELGLSFPEIHFRAEDMCLLSQEIRVRTGGSYCELPFCQTVEAESLGAAINMGDGLIGPRPGKPCFTSLEELLALGPADFGAGRALEVLEACRLVGKANEPAALAVSGPLSLANALLDVGVLLKALRRNPDLAYKVLGKLGEQSLAYVSLASRQSVAAIRYADPLVAPDIVGPKVAASIAERFTVPYLANVREIIGPDAALLVCPKTAACLPVDDRWVVACRWGSTG